MTNSISSKSLHFGERTFNTPWRIKSIGKTCQANSTARFIHETTKCMAYVPYVSGSALLYATHNFNFQEFQQYVAICSFSSAFWRQCARWHLKRRRFAPVASTRNNLVHTHTHTRTHTHTHAQQTPKKVGQEALAKPESFYLKFKQLLLKSFNFCQLPARLGSAWHVASCQLARPTHSSFELPLRQMIGKFSFSFSPYLFFFFGIRFLSFSLTNFVMKLCQRDFLTAAAFSFKPNVKSDAKHRHTHAHINGIRRASHSN